MHIQKRIEETGNPILRRDIQAVPVTIEGRQMITFIDPLKLARTGFALDRSAVPLLSMMDGGHDLRDIQMGLMRMAGGSIVPMTDVEALIKQFDHAFLLESDAFRLRKTAVMEEFAKKTLREPQLAGKSYEADPARLRSYIASIESGLPPLPGGHETEIVGIMAPHIEISAAEQAYVDAYRRLRGSSYDLVIILGINHSGGNGLYCLSDKDYITPLGTLVTDRRFIEELKAGLPDNTVAPYDFDHMMEHSIEFQTVFLAYYLGVAVKIVPVLCGGIHEFLAGGNDPLSDERFLAFRDGILRLIGQGGLNVLFVSGVDFSHVGHKFGHGITADALLGRARFNDEQIISHLIAGRPEEIWKNALATGDEFNVCGLASMMLFLSLIGRSRVELLHHGTYNEPATNSAVTFASMVFAKA